MALLILRCLCRSSTPIIADHQPIVAYHKLGRTLHRFLLVSAPDPFSSRPNIKEEKAVWLARLMANCLNIWLWDDITNAKGKLSLSSTTSYHVILILGEFVSEEHHYSR